MDVSKDSADRPKGISAFALSPHNVCNLWQSNVLIVEDNAEIALLECHCVSGTELHERIRSYLMKLAEIRREELALKELWHDLLMRIEVGRTND